MKNRLDGATIHSRVVKWVATGPHACGCQPLAKKYVMGKVAIEVGAIFLIKYN